MTSLRGRIVRRYFDIDGVDISSARIYEVDDKGKYRPLNADWSKLEALINRLKNDTGGDEELKTRVKEQGKKIGELTAKLKQLSSLDT